MPKTRQQRLAEERAGHPSSPPQQLPENTRGPRRTRAKTPSATVVAGSVVPAAQLAVSEEPQAILHVWVDANRSVYDPTHTLAIPSLQVPELLEFIERLKGSQAGQDLQTTSSSPYPPSAIETPKAQAVPPSPSPATAVQPAPSYLVSDPPIAARDPKSQPVSLSAVPDPPTIVEKHISSHRPSSPLPDILPADEIPEILRKKNLTFLSYTTAGRALYGKVSTMPKAPGPDKSSEADLISQQLDDAATNEDSDMGEPQQLDDDAAANEDSSMEDVSETNSLTGHLSEDVTPKTSRGRGWGFGSFIQSARSRFGFSPLTPVSERSEPASAQTKKKQPTTPSTRPARANNRRPSNSVTNPIIVGPNLRSQKSRGEQVAPDNSDATPPIRRNPDEAQHAQSGHPDLPILWPSRSLERSLTTNKRKRWGEPDTEQQPIKRRRIGDVFDLSSGELKRRGVTINGGQQSRVKTPIPITNPTGTFKVPSPSGSDWSDSDEEEEAHIIPTVKLADNSGPIGRQKFTAYQDWYKTACPAVRASLASMEVDPHIAGNAFKECLDRATTSGK
ncbi:hypothetical protein MMC31_006541 [Peltigera leucophlebia]|nr:hypothetical protein [Peltigera leucophlebia]